MKLIPTWLKWKLRSPDMRIKMWIVDRLPHWVIYYSLIRAGVHASTGKYSKQVVPDLTFIDALRRWETPNKCK